MTPFLQNVAQTYYKLYGSAVSEYTFVFSNRRAGVFFRKYLAEAAGQPLFSPEILTVTDLFARLSAYKQADRIEMLFILYDEYVRISRSLESFDDFLYWGEMILSDFDDVDKYMADARQLFQNIYDLKEIDAGFAFLTDEQVAAIRRFWAEFYRHEDSKGRKEFLELWETLYELYGAFRAALQSRGLAYEGMLFREVAEKAKAKEELALQSDKFVFVGLNGHSLSEEILLRYLQQLGAADFYFDYSSPLVRDPDNKASFFIDRNRQLFPSRHTLEAEEPAMAPPVVELIGVSSAVGQAKYVHTLLNRLVVAPQEDAFKTAVVLPDENLLLPTLYSIPEEIDKINVTMGYSLSNSSVAGLMEQVFNVQRNKRITDGKTGYYFRFVLSILSHKYVLNVAGEASRRLRQSIIKNNRIIVPYDDLRAHPLLERIFRPLDRWTDIADYLKDILAQLQMAMPLLPQDGGDAEEPPAARSFDVEKEFIIEYYKTINKMEDALTRVQAEMSVETYFRLLKKMAAGVSVPFTGEPLSGLQVMGVLETRSLDFENLLILSMNEGVFPQKRAANSFIPYSLRQGFGLPTYEHQDSIFAYHFYRLLYRAKRIFLLYDTRAEGLQTGEVSRYFYQMKHLYPHAFTIREKLAVYEVASVGSPVISLVKTPRIMEKLNEFSSGLRSLSASAINTYLDCPLQFYFSVVEQITEEDEISETIEADTFGSIFHSVMEWLYAPFKGKQITADLLQALSKNEKLLTETIERSFAKHYFLTGEHNPKPLTGQNFLTGEIVRRYVKQTFRTDAKLTPFIYLESERKLNLPYLLPSGRRVSLKGFIDRIDEVNGRPRIIDYKTGKGQLVFRSMEQVFDKSAKERPKAVMQVFMYAHLYLLESPEKPVEPGIYYLRNLFEDKFDAGVVFKPVQGNQAKVTDFGEYREAFRQHFDACLEELFDPAVPFTQTPVGKACEWCRFTGICKK
ncbi:MAG: PD-(D/E)XK nuclease family protein [Prevotella sp.]|jgi:RecB family exonuclease|nr:PD-(D/E)XK nuclease family protein [Prevotella sp.]